MLRPMYPPNGHVALRRARFSAAGQIYLVTTTTVDRTPIFADHLAAATAFTALCNECARADVRMICSALMPDHWHALLQLGERATLPRAINRLKSVSAIATNRACARIGQVWARAYHDRAIRSEADIADAVQYIIMNPVRAGLVVHAMDYPYCFVADDRDRNRAQARSYESDDSGGLTFS